MTGTVDLLIEAAVVDQLGAPPRHGHHQLAGRLSVQTSVHPLGEVAAAWREQAGGAGGRKIVLTP